MAEDSSDDKTESPTEKKRRDSRDEGQVAFSREFTSVAILGGFLLFFYFFGVPLLQDMGDFLAYYFRNLYTQEFSLQTLGILWAPMGDLMVIIIALLGVLFVLGVLSSVAQVGVHFTAKPLQPKFSKISLIKGFGRLFSKNTLNELFKNLFKTSLIGYIGYYTIDEYFLQFMQLFTYSVQEIALLAAEVVGVFSLRVFMAFVILSAFDYAFQRWDTEQKMKMSKQDIKEEMKQTEGDPQIKARIRQIQQKMSQARMMQEVPTADAVITNPTHFAVAIKYDRETMLSPEVIAKGADHVALRIIDIARKSEVPVIQNPPVARGIFNLVEIGEAIPAEFFKVIAEILARVYKARGRIRP